MSNCSQKARLCLEEKGLQWISHPVNITDNQHLTRSSWPLIQKGSCRCRCMTESSSPSRATSSIISIGIFPIRRCDLPIPDRTRTLVSLVKALGRNPDLAEDPVSQYDLKGRAAGMRAQMGKLEALVKNDELVEFMREFTSANGLSKDPLERATGWIERVPGELDERLAGIHGLPATPSRSPTSPGASISIDSS